MKNKGFTLIELLAVIVILAIIALIATPTILNVVETARKGAAESSVLGYIDAVEKQAMINAMDETKTQITGQMSLEELADAEVTVKGQAPTEVGEKDGETAAANKLTITEGEVQDAAFKVGNYTVDYTKATGKAVAR